MHYILQLLVVTSLILEPCLEQSLILLILLVTVPLPSIVMSFSNNFHLKLTISIILLLVIMSLNLLSCILQISLIMFSQVSRLLILI